MKKMLMILLSLLLLTGCASNTGAAEASSAPEETTLVTEETKEETVTAETEETVPEETTLPVIYANQIADGTYEISVESSSSMFRIVRCELKVENGAMTAAMTMSGQGYGMVYLGTGEEAAADTEDAYIPFVLNENEEKVFTIPVEALNTEIDCAAWSIKKETWYDRVLVFSSELLPEGVVTLE